MISFKRTVLAVGAAFALASSAQAVPINFNIANTSFTTGNGYGSGTNNDTKLDVVFAGKSTATSFALDPGGSYSFTFGSVQLKEVCIDPAAGCASKANSNETTDLGVKAVFNFTSPVTGAYQTVEVFGVAVPGPVNDGATDTTVDFSIDFQPLTVNFGTGQSFKIDLSDLSFTGLGTLNTTATITLAGGQVIPVTPGNVPEPASLALLGVGLLGAGMARRRKPD